MARLRRWLRRLALLAGLGLVLGLVGLGVLYFLIAPRLPDVQQLRNVALQVPLGVYSADGKLIAQFGETRRYPVKVDKIPTRLNAGLAISRRHCLRENVFAGDRAWQSAEQATAGDSVVAPHQDAGQR